MKEIQTPRKDLSHRRPKDSPSTKSSINDLSKKSQKIAKKNLDAVFSSVSEELISDAVTKSFNFSPVSEILSESNVNHNGESFECLLGEEEALTLSESSACYKITTVNDDSSINSGNHSKVIQSYGCVEGEVVSNLLKQARVEMWNSNDVSPVSKKLLDSLVEVSVKEFCALPEEKDLVSVLISEKTRVLVFCFAVWLITMTVILIVFKFSSSRSTQSFYLPPT
ncbi:hypothetical protein RND81_05G113900 [Saponaria officinalis]|uniref:Uncharacterized protein n=1 Tax=Saponaria officinalis TaxID=3572 RepID=A0AAW1KZV9_SAPOF